MNIIINRTDAIGDTLLTLPIAKLLKEKDSNVKVGVLVSSRCGDLMSLIDCIDEYWVFDTSWDLKEKWKFLSQVFTGFNPDTYLYAGGSHFPSFYAWIRRIKNRAGLISKWPSFLFLNKGMRQSRSRGRDHESDYSMDLLSPLGIHYRKEEREFYQAKIVLDPSERKEVWEQFKKEQGDERPIVLIHPGMSGHTLNWPSSFYGQLIKELAKCYPGRYLYTVSYTPSDTLYIKGLRDYLEVEAKEVLEKDVCFYDGSRKGLRYFTHLMAKAQLFIGPSTGTTHMANALGLKQVCFYSPIKVQSAQRWGPFKRDEQVVLLTPDVVCEERFKCAEQACSFYQCMAKIEVVKVVNSCRQLLEG